MRTTYYSWTYYIPTYSVQVNVLKSNNIVLYRTIRRGCVRRTNNNGVCVGEIVFGQLNDRQFRWALDTSRVARARDVVLNHRPGYHRYNNNYIPIARCSHIDVKKCLSIISLCTRRVVEKNVLFCLIIR